MEPESSLPYSQVPATGLFCLQRKHLALWVFLNMGFHGDALLAPRPNPQAGGPPLVGSPRLLIQFIRSYPPYRRSFLHPLPEDAPCRGDRDQLIIWTSITTIRNSDWVTKKTWVRLPTGARDFYLLQNDRTVCGSRPISYSVGVLYALG